MAGRFITNNSSNYKTMLESIVSGVKTILNNPYYLYSDKKASISTYYNINTTMTTLDEATRGNYGEISPKSPLRFNKINNMYLYGVSKIEPSLDITDMGLESSDITGEAIVLPYTVVPYPGDFFTLSQINGPYLFKVTSVNPNTLDTGATMYRITYILSSSDGIENIEPQVVKEYNMVIDNLGSNFNCLIEEADYNNIAEIERYTTMLKDYYISLFYDSKVQSFTYRNGFLKVYDPYLVEFIIRNNILKGGTDYIYVTQQMYLPATFGVAYDRTFFSALENKDVDKLYGRHYGNLYLVSQKLSLLYAYPEDYYYMEYDRPNPTLSIIDIFDDPGFRDKIKANDLAEEHPSILRQIIVNFFNDTQTTAEELKKLRLIDYYKNKELFYLIPMSIFCLEQQLANSMPAASKGGVQ